MKKKETDKEYIMTEKALKEKIRYFLLTLKLKLLLAECSINKNDKIRFRNRKWILKLELLRIEIIYQTYISIFIRYFGKEVTYKFIIN